MWVGTVRFSTHRILERHWRRFGTLLLQPRTASTALSRREPDVSLDSVVADSQPSYSQTLATKLKTKPALPGKL